MSVSEETAPVWNTRVDLAVFGWLKRFPISGNAKVLKSSLLMI